MPSALAAQLAKGASLNAPLLSETLRRKHFASSSYLFSTSTKGQIDDLDTIYALASNALSQLRQVYPSISVLDEQSHVHRTLFLQRAKETDRTLLGNDDLAELNLAIKACLSSLGPCLLEGSAGRVIEWLVRRFRVNEFNVPDVLALFLPYHESPHFAKMVSILTIEDKAPWSFLAAYKAAGKPLQRSVLVTQMLKNRELARFVVSLLPETLSAYDGRNIHRTLICLNTSVLLEYITRAERKELDSATLAFLLPALTEPLKVTDLSTSQGLRKDSILGSYVLLAALSQKCSFTTPALKTIMSGMVHCASATSAVGAYQLLTALISFLSPQKVVEGVSASVVDEMIALPDFLDALKASLQWKGAEKLLLPILGRLVDNLTDERYAALAQLLITAKNTSRDVVIQLGRNTLLSDKGSDILGGLYQRHPELLRAAAEGLAAEDETRRLEIDQALMTLAMPGDSGKGPQDLILASSNADPSVRANTVRQIAKLLADDSAGMNNKERLTLQEALLARMYDTDTSVLGALYAASEAFAPLLADSMDILSKLATFVTQQNSPRAVLRAHLAFFCNAFVSSYPERRVQVALALVFPSALFSKPRGKTAASVWEVVGKSRLGDDSLFKGTKQIIENGAEDMARINDTLTDKLAENLRASNDYPRLLNWLLENVSKEDDSHTRLFSLLLLYALLPKLSGENHVDAALRVVRTIRIASMVGLDRLGNDESSLDKQNALKNVVLKPSSRSTTQRLQLMLLTSLAGTPRPQDRLTEWFLPENDTNDEDISASYLHLQKAVYAIVNTFASSLGYALYANHAVFESFASDALLFLSSIWTVPVNIDGVDWDTTRYVALRHASAFLRSQSPEQPVDFQVILPSLLACLQASDRRVRAAAMECISDMAALSVGSKPLSIYAYEQIYGGASVRLQYLDWSDEVKYLNQLVGHRDHLVNDADCLVLFHHDHLSRSKAEGKKDTKQRQRILCFLLSHAVCCPSSSVRLSILKAIKRVSDAVKLRMLLPVIEKVLDTPASKGDEKEIELHALEAFDGSTAKELNPEASCSWLVLMRALDRCHGTRQWTCICKALQDSLFAILSANRQLEISLKMIELGSSFGDEAGIRRLLVQCINKSGLMVALLQSLQPEVKDTSARASKRAKTDETTVESESASLSRLAFLAEILSSKKLPGSFDLVTTLLDTLSRVLASSTLGQADATYVEQVLMSCLESAASQIQELPNLTPNAVRVDVLVDLMRTSENPQTFNQALLLLASLSRLSPASILHNIMPIFTFMGSNVFHRDDSYSFKVIQRTTESIVPVAIASLKDKYDDPLDLYIGSRDLLRTFTDASTHIPRHRRTSFFTHLIDVLDPADFLAPTLLLLASKGSSRVSRQDKQEARTALSLPLSVMQHYASSIQLSAMKELIKEVQRLAGTVERPGSEGKVFLEATVSEDQAVPLSTLRKRQCQTLLVLAGYSMKQLSASQLAKAPSDELRFIVTALMELATLDQSDQTNLELREAGSSAQWALVQTMDVISATFFTSTILSMLSSENRKIYQAAFGLLASRVPEMKTETREEISPVMAQIVNRMKELIPSLQDVNAVSEAMHAIMAIGATSVSKEESALTNMVPIIIDTIRKYPTVNQAIAVVPIFTTRLGPRIIPYLRLLIDTCVSLVKSSDKTSSRDALRALNSMLKTIPSFWGTQEIKLVVDLYLDEELVVTKSLSSHLDKLTKLMAKQLPSKTVLSSLLQCWPPIEVLGRPNGPNKFGRFFELLKRCIHFATRPDVIENLRSLFTNFLHAFDARSILPPNEASAVEDKIIASYLELITKLNETVFQPLFRRSVDWAFGEDSSQEKQTTFCRHYSALLDLFKELMTPYMSLLVNHFAELLVSFENGQNTNKELWLASIETVSKSFVVDDGVYWRDAKLRLLSSHLAQQIPVCVNLRINSGRSRLSDCLNALIDCLEDNPIVKATNFAVLMHTRSEDARVRIFALQCAVSIWQAHGSKLRSFGSETATFIIECAEDENDEVVRACRQLKDAVEAEVGKIEGL